MRTTRIRDNPICTATRARCGRVPEPVTSRREFSLNGTVPVVAMFIDHDSGAASKVQKPWTDAEVFPNCSSLSLRALPCAAAPVTLRTCEHVSRPALRWPGGRHDASCRRGKGAGAGVLRGDRVPQRRAARAPTAWAPSARRRVSPPVGRVGAAALGRLRAGHDGGLQPRALADPPHPHPRRPRVPSPLAAPAL